MICSIKNIETKKCQICLFNTKPKLILSDIMSLKTSKKDKMNYELQKVKIIDEQANHFSVIFNYNYLKFAEAILYKVFTKSADSTRITKKLKYLRSQSDF